MELLNLSAVFKQNERGVVLNNLSFKQQLSERLVICGETGSGKSTLLKIIAGLVQADGGQVALNGIHIKGPEEQLIPGHPGIAYLSQQYELRNHYRVEELLDMANRLSKEEAGIIYDVCRINHLTKRRTNELSGGEKQRIALARLLVSNPKLLLLDEPYSNLDLVHKSILKQVVEDIGAALGITCILASHDPLDVLSWADEMIVIRTGTILQHGKPEELYRRPVNEYVGGLLGKYNLLPRELAGLLVPDISAPSNKRLFVRPEALMLSYEAGEHCLMGKISTQYFMGAYHELIIRVGKYVLLGIAAAHPSFNVGDIIYLTLQSADIIWL